MIETRHKYVSHHEINETDNTCTQTEIGDLLEKGLVRVGVDVVVEVVGIQITVGVI